MIWIILKIHWVAESNAMSKLHLQRVTCIAHTHIY